MLIRTIFVAAIATLSIAGTAQAQSLSVSSTELTATNGEIGDAFSCSVDIDGDTCVIGALQADNDRGSAYVFTKSGGTWSQVVELTNPAAQDALFGWSVAIDGDTCVIGNFSAYNYAGSALVFTESGGEWIQVAELTASNGANGEVFGYSLAIDGDTLLIGAQGANGYNGSAYVFTNTGGNWTEVAELTATNGYFGFGYSVAIDGDTCVIGAQEGNGSPDRAYVFTNTGGTWSQVAELTATGDASTNDFGSSVAIDGDTCVIGAYGTNSGTGSAYVFTNTNGTWSQVQELTASDGAANDLFGSSVTIDGDTCVIGARGRGSAYLFTNTNGSWSQIAELTSAASDDYFGNSVALDGGTCVIGANGTNSSTGSAHVVDFDGGSVVINDGTTGACCVSSGCVATSSADCTALGGTWLGEDGGCEACPASCSGDTNSDGVIDIEDLLTMLSNYGSVCP